MAYLVLIGPMASGKSKLGRRIAKLSGRGLIDTDKLITARHGVITKIFAEAGEAKFREYEAQAVSDALQNNDAVVALGGGAILHASTQQLLSNESVVLLTVSAKAVAFRLAMSLTKRPLIPAAGQVAEWERITKSRMPIYEKLAKVTFDTTSGKLDDIAVDIYNWRESHG